MLRAPGDPRRTSEGGKASVDTAEASGRQGSNQSNGNLYLDAPLDLLDTPGGELALGLSYNSQQGGDFGLGPGWDVSAGPASSGRSLPNKLVDMGEDGLKIRFRDGALHYFPKISDHAYGGTAAGTVRVSGSTYRYTTVEGATFTFGAQGELKQADPAGTSDAARGQVFTYQFSAAQLLQKVTDGIGREISFTWTSDTEPRLSSVTAWDGRTWTLGYNGSGRLETITHPQDGQDRTPVVTFTYAGGRIAEVKDAKQTDGGTAGWGVTYVQPEGDPSGLWRVETLTPPGLASPWDFAYGDDEDNGPDFKGTTSKIVTVTDPRGDPGDPETPHAAQVEFNWAGLPIRTAGPADIQGVRPITTQLWDTNNNLVCKRSPMANAYGEACAPGSEDPDGLSTTYTYRTRAPYRLLGVTHPAAEPPPESGTDDRERATESYAYDEGAAFDGLWHEKYENGNLAGIPDREVVFSEQLDKNWGQGAPYGIDDGDHWSLRWSGWLEIPHTANKAKKYEFKVFSDDGVRLSVGGKTLLDCFGQVEEFDSFNCGTEQKVNKWLGPGLRPFTLEFQERTGSARIKLQWDKATNGQNETWVVPGTQAFQADLGLVTTTEYGWQAGSPPAQTLTSRVTYDFPNADLMARRLPRTETTTDLISAGAPSRTTRYDSYDDFGRLEQVTTAHGTALAATTTHTYTDDAPSGLSCLTETVGPLGEVTTYVCNQAGDVISETLDIDAAGPQPAQSRTTTADHDAAGRPVRVESPVGGVTETDYDLAGRPTEVRTLLDDAGTPDPGDDTWSVVTYAYDERGNVVTETLPHAPGAQDPPEVISTYDEVGNRLTRSDPRNGAWVWATQYDAQNRSVSEESPSGLLATTDYVLTPDDPVTTGTNEWEPALEVVTAPWEQETTRTFDLLGRVVSERSGTLDPATFEHDPLGNVVRITDPAGTWTEQDYDGFGQVTEERTPAQGGGSHATSFTYDAAGNLEQVDGPRAQTSGGEEDSLEYAYDPAGNLTSAAYVLDPADSQDDLTTSFFYDQAGERVRVTGPDGRVREWTYDKAGRESTVTIAPGTAEVQAWTHTYDEAGRLVETADPRGITLHRAYDEAGNLTRRWAMDGGQEVDAECSASSFLDTSCLK